MSLVSERKETYIINAKITTYHNANGRGVGS